MITTLLMAGALAAGGGLYTDFQWGAASTSDPGFVARGSALQYGLGGYWGDYSGSFRYGTYWTGGLLIRLRSIEVLGEPLDYTFSGGLRIGRGVDLIKLGAWWSVAAGPSYSYRADSLREALDTETQDPTLGAFIRVAVGGSYYLAPWLSIDARFEPGLQFTETRTSYLGGFGLGVRFRAPLIRRHWEEEEEGEGQEDRAQ